MMVLPSGSSIEHSRTPLSASTSSPVSIPRPGEAVAGVFGRVEHLEPAGVGEAPLRETAGHRHIGGFGAEEAPISLVAGLEIAHGDDGEGVIEGHVGISVRRVRCRGATGCGG